MARCLVFVLAVASFVGPLAAQERLDPQIDAKIRLEEEQHSQIMRTLHFLTDVYGPRLTGSPSLQASNRGISTARVGSTSGSRGTLCRRSEISSPAKCWPGRLEPTAP